MGFAESPDLHTAAHEAAHVVQQQAGVQLKGGIDGGKGDPYEQHADAVADSVVRGESAEGLLDTMGSGKLGSAAPASGAVQRKEQKAASAAHVRDMLETYLLYNTNEVWRTLHEYVRSTAFPEPHPRLQWANDRVFAEAVFGQLSTNIDFKGLTALDEVLYPSSAIKTIGGLLPPTRTWSVEVGLAIAHAFHIAIIASMHRMGTRYVEYADSAGISGAVEIDATKLVTSVPIDRYVAPALCMKRSVIVAPVLAKDAKPAKGPPIGVRDVSVTWQTGEMWNWVKADPADATAEEVAAKLWVVTDGHGETRASFNAYLLAAAPPLFGVPKRFAIKNPKAKAPPNALAEEDTVDRQLTTLASGSASDESALHEGAPPTPQKTNDPKAAATTQSPELNVVSDAITDCLMQLRFAERETVPWGLAPQVAPAIKYLLHKEHELKSADPARLSEWLQLFQSQKDRLNRITGGINELVVSAKKLGMVEPKGPQAAPAREILEQFALAAGLSHLAQPSEAKLAEGLRLQSLLAARAMQSTEGDMMGAIQEANERTGGDDKFMRQMSSEAGGLQGRSRLLQQKMLNGSEVDEGELDDVSMKSEEVALLSRLQGLRVELAHLNNAAVAAGKGDAAIIASLFSGKFRDLPHLSKHIFDEFQPIYGNLRSEHEDYAKEEKLGINGSAKYKAQERAQRREALGKAKQKFTTVSQDPDVVEFFQTAATTIQNQQFRTAIVQTAAMIGISIVAGAAAGLAARAVGGILLEVAGAETVADLGVVARAGINTAKFVTQVGVETTINAAGAAAVQGRSFGEAWEENLIVALASSAVFGSINRYAREAAKNEAKLADAVGGMAVQAPKTWATASASGRAIMAVKEAGTISAHTIWGAAVGEVAGHIATGKTQPPPETMREWALQGIAVAVGRHVQERLITHSEMYKSLEQRAEDGGRALTATAKKMTSLAREVISNKNARQAAELLAEHDEFLRQEIEAIDRAIAKHGDQSGELTAARHNLEMAAEAAGDEGMLGTKMTLLGMEELVPGALWKGTKEQIEKAIASQKRPVPKVTREGKRWHVQLGERVIEIQEVASAQKTVDVERVVLGGGDEELRIAAKLVPPEPGMLDVVVHGSIDDFMVTVGGRDISIDHRALAKYIEKSGVPYDRIRLLSCKAGMHPKGVAQHLANKLGVPVLAPTEKLYIHPDGKMTVGPAETRDLGKAGWQEFKPEKSSLRYEKAPEVAPADAIPGATKSKTSGAKRLGADDEGEHKEAGRPSPEVWLEKLKHTLSGPEVTQYELMKGKWASPAEMEREFGGDLAKAKEAIGTARGQKAAAAATKDRSVERVARSESSSRSTSSWRTRRWRESSPDCPRSPRQVRLPRPLGKFARSSSINSRLLEPKTCTREAKC
ncbi:MAG: hypothetical protein ABI704_10110 [Kofleriaceae bacterium]